MTRRTGVSKRVAFIALCLAVTSVLVTSLSAYAYAYGSAVTSSGAVLYNPLEDGSGTVGTSVIGPSCTMGTSSWAGGGLVSGSSSAVQGNGSVGYCYVASYSGPSISGDRSLVAWVRYTSAGDTSRVFCVGAAGSAGGDCMQLAGSGNWSVADHGSGTCAETVSGGSLADGFPHMLALTVSGSAGQLYVDGVAASGTCAGFGTVGAVCNYGVGVWFGHGCGGGGGGPVAASDLSIGQVALWSSALSSGTISSLYAARLGSGPSAHIAVTPGSASAADTGSVRYSLQSVDALGVDVTGSTTFTITGAAPVAYPTFTVTCDGTSTYPHVLSGHTFSCTTSGDGGGLINIQDNHGNATFATFNFVGAANRFSLLSNVGVPVVGQRFVLYGLSFDGNGVDVSVTDAFTLTAVPSGVTCSAVVLSLVGPQDNWQAGCVASAAGSYTFTATDALGFTSSLAVFVGPAAAASVACGSTDLGCYLTQIWDTLTGMAGDLAASVSNALFVSKTGKSYVDLSGIVQAALPTLACRSGQLPTAPDGVQCVAFPFSIPFDAAAIVGIFNVTAVAPTFPVSVPITFRGTTYVTIAFTLDPTVVLTSTVMTWVRDSELVLFVVGLGVGTYRVTQAVGVS